MSAAIRPAVAADIPEILRMVRALAAFEREPEAAVATAPLLETAMFGPDAVAHALIAERDGALMGFALYFFNFSTWTGRPGLYLEDLYVDPAVRGTGIGSTLLARLAALAVEKGCARMEWAVLDWNAPAIALYRKLGARPLSEWTIQRLEGDALQALAAGR